MWGKFCLAFVIAAIGGTILLTTEVNATGAACAAKQAANLRCEYSKSCNS